MSGESGPTPIRRPQPMRRVGFLGIESVQGTADDGHAIDLKVYEIVFGEREQEDRAAIQHAATELVRETAPEAIGQTAHHSLGFVVLHHGEDSEWLLLCWWTHECILCQRLMRADRGSTLYEPYPGPNVACTWELRVHAHEREAWAAHVLNDDRDGWRARYLGDTVSGVF